MFIYFWILLLSLFWAYLLEQARALEADTFRIGRFSVKKTLACRGALMLCALPSAVLSGFRYAVGVDYFYTYVPLYQKIASGMSLREVGTEPGYYFLNKLIILLGGGTVWVFLITSLMIAGLFFLAFYQQSESFVLSVAMFFAAESYFVSLMYVRQFIAAGFVIFGFRYIREKKFWKYALCIGAAFLFHTSAVIMLPLYVLCLLPIHPLFLAGGIAALSLLHDVLMRLLQSMASLTPYGAYWGSIFQQGFRFYGIAFFKYAILFAVAAFFYKKNKKDRFYLFCLNTMALLVYIACNFDILPQTDRICWYLELVVLLLVPMLVRRCSVPWLKPVLLVGLLSVFGTVTVSDVFVNGAHGVVPYRFVFSPDAVFL